MSGLEKVSDIEEVSNIELFSKMSKDPKKATIKLSKQKSRDEKDEDIGSEGESDVDSDVEEEAESEEEEAESEVQAESEGEAQAESDEEAEETQKGPLEPALPFMASEEEEEEEEEEEDETYLQKFDKELREDYLSTFHPESKNHNYEEIKALSRVSRNSSGIVSDVLHKTLPFLTKYEMTRVIGQRARQINAGAKTFVVVPPTILDGYMIAKMELEQKKLPFIIKRPLPNGGFEYWNVSDLELL